MTVITRQTTSYQLSGWDLSELLPETSEEVISGRLADLESAVAAFEARRGELGPGMDRRTFLDVLRQYEELIHRMQMLSGHASLWFYSDTGSPEALTLRNRVRQATTVAANRT